MSEFKREERFIVIKRKNLRPVDERELHTWLQQNEIPTSECVVVESDWPEYEQVWRMIEARVTGATPAEDGRDDAPPCAIAYMTADKRMLIFADKADAMEWDDRADLAPLYSLEDLNRIVAAKDAEIAKFKEANRELAESNVRRRDKIVELTRKLDAQSARQLAGENTVPECFRALLEHAQGMTHGTDWNKGTAATYHRDPLCKAVADCIVWLAQPARQVGGDEREYHCDYAGCSQKAHPGTSLCLEHHTPKARAALAPAAVAEVLSSDEIHQIAFELGGTNDGDYLLTADDLDALVARAIPVGLLDKLAHCTDPDCCIAHARGELRALLGKEGE